MTLTTYPLDTSPNSFKSTNSTDILNTESVSLANSTYNQYYQSLPLNKLPFDANDYLNFELNEDFINTNGDFMNDYSDNDVLQMKEKGFSNLAMSYEAEEQKEEEIESVGNDVFEDINDCSNYTTTTAISIRGSISAESLTKITSFGSLTQMDEIEADKHLIEYTDIFSNDFTDVDQFRFETNVDEIENVEDLNMENIQILLQNIDEETAKIQGEEFGKYCVSILNINGNITETTNIENPEKFDVNHIDFRCNCLTKYNKLCKNSILCFKHSIKEKSKIPRFNSNIDYVIKIYKIVQEGHALELKKMYKQDKKAEKELKKLLNKATKNKMNKINKKVKISLGKKQLGNPLEYLVQPEGTDPDFIKSLTERISLLPVTHEERLNEFTHRLNLNTLILTQTYNSDLQLREMNP